MAKTNSEDIPWEQIDGSNQQFSDVFPRLQWMHGQSAFEEIGGLQYTGGLFLADEQMPDFSAPGWQPGGFKSSGGKRVRGWYAPQAQLAVLRLKKWWDKDGSCVQALCVLKGRDDLFTINVNGVSKAKALEDAFQEHRIKIVQTANRTRPAGANPLEPFALWFVLAPSPHAMQASHKKKDANSEVTAPQLWLPPKPDYEYVKSLWVGSENYRRFCQLFRDSEKWQQDLPKQPQEQAGGGGSPLARQYSALLLQIGRSGVDLEEIETTLETDAGLLRQDWSEAQYQTGIAALQTLLAKLAKQKAKQALA
jgi:hypothetical protein